MERKRVNELFFRLSHQVEQALLMLEQGKMPEAKRFLLEAQNEVKEACFLTGEEIRD